MMKEYQEKARRYQSYGTVSTQEKLCIKGQESERNLKFIQTLISSGVGPDQNPFGTLP